jgi:hypothetical protein
MFSNIFQIVLQNYEILLMFPGHYFLFIKFHVGYNSKCLLFFKFFTRCILLPSPVRFVFYSQITLKFYRPCFLFIILFQVPQVILQDSCPTNVISDSVLYSQFPEAIFQGFNMSFKFLRTYFLLSKFFLGPTAYIF